MRPSRWNLPVPGTRRTRTTASLRRPTVWMGRSMITGSRGAASTTASVTVSVTSSATSVASATSATSATSVDLGHLGHVGHFGLVDVSHCATCLIS